VYYSKDDPIEKLDLSARSLNGLHRAGIITMGQLFNLDHMALHNTKNLGAKSIEEILRKCQSNFLYDSNDSEKEIPGTNNVNTFCGTDGIEYQDMPIEGLELSNRSYNCLKRAGILMLSELHRLSEAELRQLPNMGAKSTAEIMNLLGSKILIPTVGEDSGNFCSGLSTLAEAKEQNNYIIKELSSALGIPSGELFTEITPRLEGYWSEYNPSNSQNLFEDEHLWQCLLSSKLVACGIQSVILNALYHQKYGTTFDLLLQLLPEIIRQPQMIKTQLLLMDASGSLTTQGDQYFVKRMTTFEYADKLHDEREKRIFTGRIKGRTLEDLGNEFGIERERIRQIESKILRKKQAQGQILYEDQYSEIFEKYDLQRDDFILGFNESADTYNYLNLAYKRGSSSIDELVDDISFPEEYRRAAEKIIYKNYVRIGKDWVPCRRADLCDYVLRTFAVDDITFDEFTAMYQSLLTDLGLQADPKLELGGRGYENKMAASDHVLWKQWKTMRYYRIAEYDYAELLETLDLNSYENVEYSALKFFIEYPELMKSYDIRDEYELHNLLKKICSANDYPNINFKRMPTLEFGVPDRDRQITDLLISSAPISKEEFADLYEQEYGVKAVTVMANYAGCIAQYLDNGIYKIDLPALPNIMFEKLKEKLTDDFYLISELMQVYTKLYPTADRGMINTYTINSLGFHTYSNYLISTKYHSAVDYFRTLLTAEDVTDLANIKKSHWTVVAFSSELYKRRAEYEIIEFSPLKYINIRRIQCLGVTQDDFRDFCQKVYSSVEDGGYFTIHSLRKNGFHHPLDELGFESRFYSSILAEDKTHFSYRRMGGLRLFRKGTQDVLLEEFVESIIYQQDSLSMELHDLVNYLDEAYDLQINRWKLLETIHNSSMYYDKITEKVYAEYEVYFEEI
jgi:hypothetical protein